MFGVLLFLLLQPQPQVEAKVESHRVMPASQTLLTLSVDVHDEAVDFHPEHCGVEVLASPPWLDVAAEQALFEPAEPGVVRVQIPASVAKDASGKAQIRLKVKVYYCNNFQGWCRADTVEVTIPVLVSVTAAKVYAPPPLWPLVLALILLGCALGLVFLPLGVRFGLAVGFVVFGLVGALMHGEHTKAHNIATQLCVSCIGLEHTYILHGTPRISEETKRFLAQLENQYEIVAFSAEWCTNCPYAKAVVKEFVKASGGRLTMRVVDVEKEKEEAARWPIERGGRVALPAVAIRTKEGVKVLFGAQNLESRLLQLLRTLEGKQ